MGNSGVECIYSTSRTGESQLVVRFLVGEDIERSLVRLTEKLRSNYDRIPAGVGRPLIKPKSIDDVPILTLTFHSPRYDHLTLRRLVAQVDDTVKQAQQVAETTIIGGTRRQLRVLLDPARLAARHLTPAGIVPMLRQANRQFASGGITSNNEEIAVETGGFLQSAEDAGNVVVGVFNGRPVYLREVAEIMDGAEEPSNTSSSAAARLAACPPPRNPLFPSPWQNGPEPTRSPLPTTCCAGWKPQRQRDSVGCRGVRDAELRRNGRGKVQ